MIRHLARRSIAGLVSGCLLMGGVLAAAFFSWSVDRNVIPLLILAYLVGAGLYLWG